MDFMFMPFLVAFGFAAAIIFTECQHQLKEKNKIEDIPLKAYTAIALSFFVLLFFLPGLGRMLQDSNISWDVYHKRQDAMLPSILIGTFSGSVLTWIGFAITEGVKRDKERAEGREKRR